MHQAEVSVDAGLVLEGVYAGYLSGFKPVFGGVLPVPGVWVAEWGCLRCMYEVTAVAARYLVMYAMVLLVAIIPVTNSKAARRYRGAAMAMM